MVLRELGLAQPRHDRLRAIVEQHAHKIDEVVAIRDDLDQRLRRELATSADLKTKFESTAEALNANRALLLERESALAEEERRQAQLMPPLFRDSEIALAAD